MGRHTLPMESKAGPGLEHQREGGHGTGVRERGMADDTIVYLASAEDVPRLFAIIREFEVASGQKLNEEKSVGVLFGAERVRQVSLPSGVGSWVRFGEEKVDKTLGVAVGTESQVRDQWSKLHGGVREECTARMSRLRGELSVSARCDLVRGAYASRLFYEEQVQVPRTADVEIARTQRAFNEAVFGITGKGGHAFVSYSQSYQLREYRENHQPDTSYQYLSRSFRCGCCRKGLGELCHSQSQ